MIYVRTNASLKLKCNCREFLIFPVWKTKFKLTDTNYIHSGSPANTSRYQKIMALGYLCPTAIVVITVIADASLPYCDPYKPRFGEDYKIKCFFAGIL